MRTVGFINQKGGVGKTTLSVHFAAWLRMTYPDAKILLLDVDPQMNSQQWAGARKATPLFPVLGKPMEKIHREFEMLSQGYDFVVIDAPANVSKINGSAVLCCDTVVVPVQPCSLDIWASVPILEVIENLQGDSDRKTCFLLNQKAERSRIGRAATKALEGMPVKALGNFVPTRSVWKEAMSEGKTVFEVSPKGPARKEADMVFDELMRFAQ